MGGADEDLLAWDKVAEAYAARVGEGSDPIYHRFHDFLWRHLGEDLSGLNVLESWLRARMAR